MKKNIITLIVGIFLLVSMISFTNAQIQFWQKNWQGDGVGEVPYNVTRNHAYIQYNKDIDDNIKGNNPLNVIVKYDAYVETWNELNPEYPVDWCNFTITYFPTIQNNSVQLFNKLITDDYRNADYFVVLYDGDNFIADMDCHFSGGNNSLRVPASFQISTPTWECKACQYYEWRITEQKIEKTETIGDYVVDVSEKIKNLINLNYEIWLALFWVILIIIAVHSTALLFIGLIWMFGLLKNLAK